MELRTPTNRLVLSYLDFIEEMRALGEKVWEGSVPRATESPEKFVSRLLRAEVSPEPGSIPETVYWAVHEDQVVGRIALRHALDANLKEFGGHIGYEVRPSARRMGVATMMLRKILETPRAKKIGRLLLTCAPDNVGSNRTILTNGGVLEKTAFVQKWNRNTNYYWIDLKS